MNYSFQGEPELKEPQLSKKEQQILGYMVAGLPPVQIAEIMGISEPRLMDYKTNMYRKIGDELLSLNLIVF